ncbi:hypothetical protein THRCLA_05013 [Thraustotheca clavata]|uniref:Nephrocystin 3-like N-terminal domain-containing protein n=1 Tax=Thraustotheca clavata TaxID=74557 RepID=A0A1V9ZXV7_9STRA|nr:hypothetical protein THRCLA_05013 [Thraustotheca clavata]
MAIFFRRSSIKGNDDNVNMPRERVTLSNVAQSAITGSSYGEIPSSYQLGALQETITSINKQFNDYKRETIARLDHVEGNMQESTKNSIEERQNLINQRNFKPTTSTEGEQAAMEAMKEHVEGIRRDVMTELHTTRYDLLKEMAMLRGAVMQLCDMINNGDRKFSVMSDSTTSSETDSDSIRESNFTSNPKVPYLPAPVRSKEKALAAKEPSKTPKESTKEPKVAKETKATTQKVTRESKVIKESSRPSRESSRVSRESVRRDSTKGLFRESARMPIKDQALTEPWENVLNKHLPFIETQKPAMEMIPKTRKWAIARFTKWVHDASISEPVNDAKILNVVGGGGTGKTTLLSHIVSNYPTQIMASHFVRYDERHSTLSILMSLAHQISCKLPDYQQQLVRLNLPYLIQEPDPVVLATKLLIEPMNLMQAPLEAQVIVLDAVDEDLPTPSMHLVKLLSQCALEFPSWVLFLISSRPDAAAMLPTHDTIRFDMDHRSFAADCTIAVQSIMEKHQLDDKNILHLLKAKSQGNFLFLQFVDQAFSMIHSDIDAGMVLELPKTLTDIYTQVFEEKYGKGRRRVWQKVQPVLEAILGAATISHQKNSCPFVTEADVQHIFKLSAPDLALIARSLEDIVYVNDGMYHLENKCIFDYLTADARTEEDAAYVNVERGLHYLTKGNVPFVPNSSSLKKTKVSFDV